MQRLQEQRTNGTDEHRCVRVYAPDRILLAEPPLTLAPDLGVLPFEIPGNAIPHCFGDGGSRVWECLDRHITERMRRPVRISSPWI
jgi:hypothetical protein